MLKMYGKALICVVLDSLSVESSPPGGGGGGSPPGGAANAGALRVKRSIASRVKAQRLRDLVIGLTPIGVKVWLMYVRAFVA